MAERKRKVRHFISGGLLIITGLYFVCLIAFAAGQRSFLYFPCKTTFSEFQAAATKEGWQPWINKDGDIIGWQRPAPSGNTSRAIIFFHGNAGCVLGWHQIADRFQAIAPFDVYFLEYPGYGGRKGSPNQTNFFAAADDALMSLSPTCTVFVVGASIGTGSASYLAGTNPDRIKGVWLIAPFNNLTDAGRTHFPIFPVGWIIKDKYASDHWLKSYHGPLAIAIAEHDTVVPPELGRKLFDGYAGPKKLWTEMDATHDSIQAPRADLYDEVVAFWNEPH